MAGVSCRLAFVMLLAGCASLLQGCGGNASFTCKYDYYDGSGGGTTRCTVTITCDGETKMKAHTECTAGGKTTTQDITTNLPSGDTCNADTLDKLKPPRSSLSPLKQCNSAMIETAANELLKKSDFTISRSELV